MFDSLFPKEWTTLQRLMWLKTNALARAVYETISGNPVSFTARNAPLKQLKVAFSPVQDLHGYDSPWPAGGGKNLWGDLKMAEDIDSAIPAYSTIDTTNKTVSIESAGAITRVVLFSGIFKENTQYTFIASGTFDSVDRFNFKFAYTDDTTSATFVNGANVSDAGKTVSAVIAWQYARISYLKYEECGLFEGNVPASAFTPYSNICPILGWDSFNVEQRGKNLLALPVVPYNSVMPYQQDTSFDPADYMWLKAGTYTFSYKCNANNRWLVKLADKNGNMLSAEKYKPADSCYYNYSGWFRGSDIPAGNASVKLTIVEDCYVRTPTR